jgi:putative hydrolase of the HAD superfamily
MIKAVLFDYEGVVAVKGNHLLSEQLGRNLGIPAKQAWEELLAPEQHNFLTGAVNEPELWEHIERRYGKPIDMSARNIWQAYTELKHQPAVVKLASRLRQRGIITGILSNVIVATRDSVKTSKGYDDFDPVFLSCEVGFMKPDEAMYIFALQKLKLKVGEVLFIDDKQDNVLPANKLGMYTIVAESPEQIVQDVTMLIEQENGVDL